MEKRSKRATQADSNLKAMGKGERTSKKVSTIRTADGSSFRRKNANQYGAAEGGNDYTEKRVNRTDSFETGGTADSAENGGANVGGTLGSSMMKRGGGVIEEGDIVLVKSSKLKGEVTNKGTDFVTIEYIGKRPSGGDKKGTFKLNELKLVTEFANGGGLANVPESFPETDAMSYKTGGSTKGKSNYKKFGKNNSRLVNFDIDDLDSFESMEYDQFSNSMDKADALQILINNVEGDYSQLNEQLAEIAEEQYPSDEFFEDTRQYSNGGSTKGFEYSIGGL